MAIPEIIGNGNYRIDCLLGSGGMADVYLATHILLNKPFAIKVMKPQLSANDPMMAKRFVREAKLAQKVDHPNIVKVFDVGCDENTGLLYIVMEYVEGMNLSDYSQGGDISSRDLRAIAYEMTRALIALQKMGIVHRDIKPSNIMLCNDGSLKLMDLGIAKALHPENEGEATLTVEQAVLGTPAYSSPEQCMNSKTVDIRSDIYCLGSSLYAIASGRVPYGGTTAMEILLKVLENKPQPLAEIRPDLDADLIALIDWMMEKSPDKRPQTPQELLNAIVSKKIPGKWKRHGRKAIVASVALVFVLLLVFLTLRRAPASLAQNELNNASDNTPEVKLEEPASERPSANERPSTKQGAITQQPKSELARQIAPAISKPTNEVKTAEGLVDYKKHVTLEERLADVEEKIAKDSKPTKYTDSEISKQILQLAKQADYVSSHFDEFKALVHQVQRFRIKEQIKRYEFAKNLDRSKFDAEATREVQEFFAAYTKERHDSKSYTEFSDKLLSLLKSGRIDPNVQVVDMNNPQRSGPLLFAILSGNFHKNENLVSELLKLGADANEVLENKPVGFFERNFYNTVKSCHMVLTNGGVNRLESWLFPFFNCNYISQEKPISELILLNHDVSEKDTQDNTALHYAVKYVPSSVVIALLIASGADINARNKNGETPLFDAVKSCRPLCIKLLLDLGADATVQNKDGKTALTYRESGLFIKAVKEGDLETMRMYFEKGFSPDTILEGYKGTLLEYAIDRNDLKMVELLLKYKADTELHGAYFCTPLSFAMEFRPQPSDIRIFSLLLKYGANPNTTPCGWGHGYLMDYLMTSTIRKFKDEDPQQRAVYFMKELVACGRAKVENKRCFARLFDEDKKKILAAYLENTKEFQNDVPILPYAFTANESDETIKLLIEKKANVNSEIYEDKDTRTALYIAVERSRLSMVKLLLEHGADKGFVSKSGKSILQLKTSEEIKNLLK